MNKKEYNETTPRNLIEDQINNLRENVAAQSPGETLKELFNIFFNYTVEEDSISLLQSKVAFLLEELMEAWQKEGKIISDLEKEIADFFASNSEVPDFFKLTRQDQLEKRQPSLLESIHATLERFRIMERLETVFEKPCKGIIVGGSLSYGPFYNVRAEQDEKESSDIDVILILDPKSSEKDWETFEGFTDFSESDRQLFLSRKEIFLKSLLPSGTAMVLSQKFRLSGSNHDVSMHFFTEESFAEMLVKNINRETEGNNKIAVVKDYKAKPFPHQSCPQLNFEGVSYNYSVPEQKITEQGVIVELPAYIISDHKFHPGIYQNLILPRFFVFHDRDGEIIDRLSLFKEGIIDHIKSRYGDKDIEVRILKSHTRNALFPKTLEQEIKN